MREKEHWQDYLIPFFWVAGLFMVMISVAVLGRLGAQLDSRIYVPPGMTDVVMAGTTNDDIFVAIVERIGNNNPDPFGEEDGVAEKDQSGKEADPDETPEEVKPASDRVGVPETRNSYELDKWVDKINVIYRQENKDFNPENAAKLLAEKTDLKESDGAFYYFALGYLHDYMSRDSQLFRKSNYARTIENYTKAIELDDSVAIFYHFRGQVNYFYAQYENAPKFYEKALDNYKIAEKRDPTWPMPVDMQGWVAFKKGNYEEAIIQLERALEVDAECLDALNCMVQVYVRMSDNNPEDAEIIKKGLAAIKRLHTLLKEGKTFGNTTYVSGWAGHLAGRLIRLGVANIETHPEFFSRQEHLNRIIEALRNKEYTKVLEKIDVLEAYHESIYFGPNYSSLYPSSQSLAERLAVCRAVCYYETGDYENALKQIKTLPGPYTQYHFSGGYINQPPHSPISEYYIKILTKLQRYDELLEWSSQESNLQGARNRMYVTMYINYALFKTGQTEKACKMFANYHQGGYANLAVHGIKDDDGIFAKLQESYFPAHFELASKESAETARQPNSQTNRLINWVNGRQQSERISPDQYKKVAELLVGQKNYQQAIPLYERYIHYAPNDETTLYAILGCYQLAEQYDANAVRIATQLIAIAPKNADYWLERAYMQHKFSRRGDQQQVLFDVTRAIELLEASGETGETLQRAYMQRAELQNDPITALKDCLKIIEMAPPGTKLEAIRGETFQYPEGISVFDLAMKAMPSALGIDPDFVLSVCEQFLKKGGDERRLLGIRASLYTHLGQHAKAIDDYKVVVLFEPSENDTLSKSDAYGGLGDCYYRTRQFDEAIESFSLSLEENPRNWRTYECRAQAYQAKGSQPGLTEEQRKEINELASQDQNTARELLNQQNQR